MIKLALISPFDAYETLLHLLQDQTNIHSTQSKYLKKRVTRDNSNNGYSLFMPVLLIIYCYFKENSS